MTTPRPPSLPAPAHAPAPSPPPPPTRPPTCAALLALAALAATAGCSLILSLFTAGSAAPASLTVALRLIADGFTSPVALVAPPDDTPRLFVVDQIGRVYILDETGTRLPDPFLDITDRLVALMNTFDERGLLSLAFHPRYADNGRFFVAYNAPPGPRTPADFDSVLRISEFHVADDDPDRADPDSERIILEIDKPQFNHNGGQLAFGPDNLLYIGVGDGGGANDVGTGHTPGTGNAQDPSSLLGKILRIDIDGAPPFAIPPDNPFAMDPDVRDEIFALGLRNPWRFAFDTGPNHRLFVGDAGQNLFEEIDIVTRGGNYGWNLREGRHCFSPDSPDDPPGDCPDTDATGRPLADPIIEYPHTDDAGLPVGTAVIGGFVYRGADIPQLAGQYVFGDFSTGFLTGNAILFAATEHADGSWSFSQLLVAGSPDGRIPAFLHAFGTDHRGEIYVLTSENLGPTGNTGAVWRLEPPP